MILARLLLLLALSLSVNAEDPPTKDKPPTVRVLLAKLNDDALIEVRGRHLLHNLKTDEWIATESKKKRARIFSKENGLFWDRFFPGISEMRIVPSKESASILVNGIQYKGCIEIYSIGGAITIVNEVDTENYLKSVLGPKISPTWSKEALDAIAITERTHLFYLIQKDSHASWQIEAEAVGYRGLLPERQNRAVASAIDRTRNLIMGYQNKPFAASWSENHAGRSASYSAIFRKNCPVPQGVNPLPSLANREKSRYRTTVPFKTLAQITGLSEIVHIDLFVAEQSKKVYAVRFIGPEGRTDIGFFKLQHILGTSILPSNDFTITIKGETALITGYGKGTGVGLCTLSAEILAQKKATARSILLAHFPGVEILDMRQKTGAKPTTSFICN